MRVVGLSQLLRFAAKEWHVCIARRDLMLVYASDDLELTLDLSSNILCHQWQ